MASLSQHVDTVNGTDPPCAETETDAATSRCQLPQGAAFWLVGSVMGLLLFAAAAPSPLYALYQARWQFSTTTLTAVFASYALAVLVALLLFGSVSDHLGRRPVLIASLAFEVISLVVFAAAGSVAWLYVARGLQGAATGVATGVISAALLDLAPKERSGRGPLVNTVSLSAGLSAGAVITGALVAYGPDPTVLVYLLLAGVFVAAIAAIGAMPEPVTASRPAWKEALRPRRAAVPADVRGRFAVASAGLVAAFAISGLYLSLGPDLAARLLHSHNHLTDTLPLFLLFGAGALAQTGLRSWPARRAVAVGAAAMIVGLAVTDAGIATSSGAEFLAGGVVAGAGFGLSVMGAFRTVAGLADPERRAEVTSAAYIVIYLALAVPAVAAGLGSTLAGLTATTYLFTAIVAALGAGASAGAHTIREATRP